MSLICACSKTYKTQRGYDAHVAGCAKAIAGATSSSTSTASASTTSAATSAESDNYTPTTTAAGLTTLFTRFENLLYGEGTVAEKAREDIISLMIIRLLEPKFVSGEIDIMDVEKHAYSRLVTTENIKYVCMKVLAELSSENIMSELSRMWRSVLSVHPITREIFKSDRYLSVRSDSILAAMVRDLAKFDFESLPADCIADVYQHFIHKQFKGEKSSRLGQHFTPGHVVKHMIEAAAEYVPAGAIICDPFCGTGGFLLAAHGKFCAGRDPVAVINGTEIDVDVFRYATANLLISSGKMCTGIRNRSAFDKHDRKYGAIFTNPPFGGTVQKGSIDASWFAPTATNTRNLLCLQLCMKMLADYGVCSVVFPAGTELSTLKGAAAEVRKRLCEEFQLISVTNLPKGSFEYTGIGTVIITFRASFATADVVFYEFKDGVRRQLHEVDYATLESKGFSFNSADYVVRAPVAAAAGFEIKKLGEICTFCKNEKKSLAGDGKESGKYRFYTSSYKEKYCDQYQYEGPNILVGSGGNVNVHLAEKFDMSGDLHILTANDGMSAKYVYLYLKYNPSALENVQNGATIKHISKASLAEIEIPVPSLEYQNEIVGVIDRMEETKRHLAATIDGVKFEIEVLGRKMFSFECGTKTLETLANIKNGDMSTKMLKNSGSIPFYSCSAKNPIGFHDEFTTECNDKYILLVRSGGSENNRDGDNVGLGNVHLVTGRTAYNTDVCCIIPTSCDITAEYIYWYLKRNKKMLGDMAVFTTNLGHIGLQQVRSLEIPVPTAEVQAKICAKFDVVYAKLATLTEFLSDQEKRTAEMFNSFVTQC